ncbi:MAG: class I SAM-dependent methyltransferase, partial [Acidobacteria bacterium]|nr:class I SAM-dependent methyltransferase [Acidobacteriota bacterium]
MERYYYEDPRWPWRADDVLRRYLPAGARQRRQRRQRKEGGESLAKALDVGMGYGRNALWLAEQGYEVEGWELDGRYLHEARAEAKRRGVDGRVRFRRVDFARAKVVGPYEVIVISQVLHHVPRSVALRVLRGTKRALAPGGRIFLLAKLAGDRYFQRWKQDPSWRAVPG